MKIIGRYIVLEAHPLPEKPQNQYPSSRGSIAFIYENKTASSFYKTETHFPLSTVQRTFHTLLFPMQKGGARTYRSLLKFPSIATSERSNDESSVWGFSISLLWIWRYKSVYIHAVFL